MVTADTIISWLTKQVQDKNPIPHHLYLESAVKLNLLIGDENTKLYELEFVVNHKKAEYLSQDMTNAKADTLVKATEDYKNLKIQSARVKQIEAFILLAKKMATHALEEQKNGI